MAQLALYGLVSVIPYGINHWTIFMEFRYHPELSVIYAPQVEQWKLIVLVVTIVELVNLVTFAMIVYRKHFTWHFDILSFGILSGIHLFFFIAIFTTGIYHELPIVIPLALAMFLVHCFLHFFPYLLNPKRIYFFKKMRMVAEDKGERIGAMIDAAFR